MPDYMPATIIVPTFALSLKMIQTALQIEGPFDETVTRNDGTTALSLHQAGWGEFAVLEIGLVAADIAFDRQSDASDEYDAEVRYFRPDTATGAGLDIVRKTLHNHDPILSLSSLAQLAASEPLTLDAIRAYLGLPEETVAEWTARHTLAGKVLA